MIRQRHQANVGRGGTAHQRIWIERAIRGSTVHVQIGYQDRLQWGCIDQQQIILAIMPP